MPLIHIRNVIFDFDGTIVDSYGPITRSFNCALAHFGKPELTVDGVRPYVGIGLEVGMEHLLGKDNADEGVRLFRELYDRIYIEGTKLMPSARETLDALHGRFHMGLCSNKMGSAVRGIAGHLAIDRYFDVILGAHDVPELKPHPVMLEKALETMGATPADSLFVGDTLVDVEFSRACELLYVLVLGGSGTRAELQTANPVALLENLAQLPPFLGVSKRKR